MKSFLMAIGLLVSSALVASPAMSAPMEVVKKFEVKEEMSELSLLQAIIAKLEKRIAILEAKLNADKAKRKAMRMAKKKSRHWAKAGGHNHGGSTTKATAVPEIDGTQAGLALALVGGMLAVKRERKKRLAA